jgi:hypothetical protein
MIESLIRSAAGLAQLEQDFVIKQQRRGYTAIADLILKQLSAGLSLVTYR